MPVNNISLTSPYATEQQGIERRRRLAEMMQQQSMEPQRTEMVGGWAIPQSPLTGISRLAQALAGTYGMKDADERQKALADRVRGDRADTITKATDAMRGTPSQPTYEGMTGGLDEGMPMTAAVPGDMRRGYEILAGSNDPSLQTVGLSNMLKPAEKIDAGNEILMVQNGQVVARYPKGATPDAIVRRDTTLETHNTPSAGTLATIASSEARHDRPSGSATLGADVTRRGQDMTDSRTREEGAANRGLTLRGQDLVDRRTRDEGAANRGLTVRGQDLTDARARETLTQGKVTDTQRTAAGYAGRMVESEKIMDGLGIDGKPGLMESSAAMTPVAGKLLSNVARSPERQQYRQAQEDWVRAKLRKESGAVIADEEMDREIRTYFPQLGDGPEVIEQKKAARNVAINGMVEASGNATLPTYTGPERRAAGKIRKYNPATGRIE